MYTILITGCSMHSNDLITELRNNYDGEPIRIVGINAAETALLRKGVDAGYVVPLINDPDYIPTVLDICLKENVDVILPFITAELPIMAENKAFFEEHGIKVSVASMDALNAAGNKVALAAKYPDLMPKQKIIESEQDIDDFAAEVGYPDKEICCKLPNRCGGVGFAILDEKVGRDLTIYNKFGVNRYITMDMFKDLARHTEDTLILQEYEVGIDYSMCCLAENGKLLFALGFEASLMAFGSAMFAEIKMNNQAYQIAKEIIEDTGLDGNCCFDFILKDNGSVKLLEVNPRLSATLPFIARAGLNLPYLRVKQLMGHDVSTFEPKINYALRMSKNYESEYFTE
ncbi:MAG: ATP-grasp domain-containing protein [Ruminococcus sp.]|nr:ATP-grasp domain-containing protein [Ruminococcus sp.]